jgi:hypothetical protein
VAEVRGDAEELKKWTITMARDRIPNAGGDLHRRVVVRLDQYVIEDWPVGNPESWLSPPPPAYVGGHSRGEWQMSIGDPPEDEVSEPGEVRDDAEREAANLAVVAEIEPGQVSWLVNRAPYSVRLNEGWSPQMAAGSVQKAIQSVKLAAESGDLG